jgi:predicted PhzF superfamily epimerase YddE/YHI9
MQTAKEIAGRFAGAAQGRVEGPHCALIPYWSERLGKKELRARQISKRGGELLCQDRGDRAGIGGNAVIYVEGKVHLRV